MHEAFCLDSEENIKFDTEEILDVQWLDLDKVKNMNHKELRGYDTSIQFIKATKQIVIDYDGHLNSESGYTEFKELLKFI